MADDRHVPQNTMDADTRAAIGAKLRATGAEAWTTLLARALTVREEWDHAAAELDESEATPGPNDGPWNAWHLLNHVGGFTTRAAEHLRAMAAGEAPQLDPGAHWLGDGQTFLEFALGRDQRLGRLHRPRSRSRRSRLPRAAPRRTRPSAR